MYLSEFDGPHKGCRAAAIEGHREIARRCSALGVDTIVVLDVHWLVNAGYHVNCGPRFHGVYTSHELPHFIRDMGYDYPIPRWAGSSPHARTPPVSAPAHTRSRACSSSTARWCQCGT
jgi:3,4-dihydroxyphenylacetate 2,3-dioxygenase